MKIVKLHWLKSVAALAVFAGAAFAVQQAQAACGMPDPRGMKPAVYLHDGVGGLLKTEFPGEDRVEHSGGPFNTWAITGLWKFNFVSDGKSPSPPAPPEGVLVDSGFVTWHDDGTEIMNSGRAPVSGSFCMGVWKPVGVRTYKLTHWALGWIPHYEPGQTSNWTSNPDGSAVGGDDEAFDFFGPIRIQETIALSRDGNHYTGTFTLTQYVKAPASSTPPLGVDVTQNAGVALVITGSISATRLTVD